MIIKLILSGGFLLILTYSFVHYRRSRMLSFVMQVVCISGILMVILPEETNVIAKWVGVGRGADLVLYCFVVTTLLVIFNLHLRLRSMQEAVTEIARAVALMSGHKSHAGSMPDREMLNVDARRSGDFDQID